MRIIHVLLFLAVRSTAAFCYPGGVLENVRKIQVDPTVIGQPEKVKDAVAASLVRFDLRAAVRDALLEEGDSPIRAHIVLDEFTSDGTAKRVMNFGTGRSPKTVDGRLVIQDASTFFPTPRTKPSTNSMVIRSPRRLPATRWW